jgi:transposase
LDERLRRLWAATEALTIGARGLHVVSIATGLSKSTIRAGIRQLNSVDTKSIVEGGRIRKKGGGRKSIARQEGRLQEDLQGLMEGYNAKPCNALIWTCKSLRRLAAELGAQGYHVSYKTVSNLLHGLGYNFGKRGDYKQWSLEDRRECFRKVDGLVKGFLEVETPVLFAKIEAPTDTDACILLILFGLLSRWLSRHSQKYPDRVLLVLDGAPSGSDWALLIESFRKEFSIETCIAFLPPGTWRWQNSRRQISSHLALREEADNCDVWVSLDVIL